MSEDFSARLPHRFYGDHVLYHAYDTRLALPKIRAWEFAGWRAESRSWSEGCYIHAGLSGMGPVSIRGAGAKDYLQSRVINSLDKFPVGSMKHGVMCDERGLIAAHGIIERKGEEHFESFAGGPPGPTPRQDSGGDVEIEVRDDYLFQIAGPTALRVLEKATGGSLRDLRFLRFRETKVAGLHTEIARLGMSGSLAYELHGPSRDGPAIYEAILEAGRDFGIERLGWKSYLVNHIEGGFPQHTWTFIAAVPPDKWPSAMKHWQVSGSVDPLDIRSRNRTPVEVRWHNMARFDHDFTGREALAAEMEAPRRTTVTLRWNGDDVMDIFASLLRPEEPYKTFDLPLAVPRWPMAHADHVTRNGREIGWSSGTVYSSNYREFLSHGCLEIGAAAEGDEVIVLWGDHGGRIKEIRATVARFPYLAEGRNSEIDVTDLPG